MRATYPKAHRPPSAALNETGTSADLAAPEASPLCASPKETRASINRANSQHSTGPRSAAGKQRSSLNATTHGLTSQSPVLASEDLAAYQLHCRQFLDEYQPATPTENQLTQEIADTAWRLNRIPLLESALLSQDPSPQTLIPSWPPSACTASDSPASSKKPSSNSARSKPSAANYKSASSSVPQLSWNSINTKGFRTTRPSMASFFQKTKSKPTPNA